MHFPLMPRDMYRAVLMRGLRLLEWVDWQVEWTQSGPATQLGQARELLHVAERREAAGNLIGENPRSPL